MKNEIKEHWDKAYAENDENELGWYQDRATPSLELLTKTDVKKGDIILDVGSGTSIFINDLIDSGFRNIIATDISEVALTKAKEKLGNEKSKLIKFILDDITKSTKIKKLKNIALWHDRAVFHFLTEEAQRKSYKETLNEILKIGGYVIIGTFSLEAPKQCSGLDVSHYNVEMLANFFGQNYKLQDSFDYMHYTPSGKERQFTYALFKRLK